MTRPLTHDYCTADEAARMLGVHPSQVTRYVRKRQLPAQRIGRQVLLLRRDVERFQRPGQGFRRDIMESQKS